jgi:hypothetical protein
MNKAQSINRAQTAASHVVLCSALTLSLGRKTLDPYREYPANNVHCLARNSSRRGTSDKDLT